MSKKESFDERVKKLEAREEKIKLQLDSNSDEMKSKVMRAGKIALVTGAVALIGYWIFNVIFQDDDESEEKPRKKKKRNKESKGFTERIVALAMPYVNKALDGILTEEEEEEKQKED